VTEKELMERYASEPKEVRDVLKWFAYGHLPMDSLRCNVSAHFCELACKLVERVRRTSGQKIIALQKLLEAKDAAVRAAMEQEGAF